MNINKFKITDKKGFSLAKCETSFSEKNFDKESSQEYLDKNIQLLEAYQDKLYAEGKNGVLIIFQAMDAAGKDSSIKHVFSGLNPQGVDVFSFKQPSTEELSHDYLWRVSNKVPQRGKMAIFNRSYYEDVLVAKVHKLYKNQSLPDRCKKDDVIQKRYAQIKSFEKYLWENGITIVKIFLHVSKEEQTKRFLERINEESKNWKFSAGDMKEREYWDDYQNAYEKAIMETATKKIPWYVVPADKKWFTKIIISEIIIKVLEEINPKYPEISKEAKLELEGYKKTLESNKK